MNYKDYSKLRLGESDIASLVMVGCTDKGADAKILKFGSDGYYTAYMVDDRCEIPDHYTLEASFHSWLKIYDDTQLAVTIIGNTINIYRADDFGCIIQTKEANGK